MSRLGTRLATLAALLLTAAGETFSGGCLFDEPYGTCGYSQADDDDFNWEQVNTLTKPTSDPWMPSGLRKDKCGLTFPEEFASLPLKISLEVPERTLASATKRSSPNTLILSRNGMKWPFMNYLAIEVSILV